MAIEYNFTLDMDRSKRDNNIAYARTGDVDSITINADLVLNGAAYTPTGTNAFFECVTPNGHSVRAAAEKTGSSVSVEVPSAAFQAAGVINVAYFRFETGEVANPTYVESTEPFAIVVREGVGDNIDAGDYIEEWRGLADQLEAAVAEVEKNAEQAKTAINEQKTEVDQLKAQAQKAIAGDVTEVEEAAKTAISAINQEKADVANAAEGITEAGEQAINTFNTNSQQALSQFSTDSTSALSQFSTNSQQAISTFNSNGETAISSFESDSQQAIDTFNSNGSSAISSFNTSSQQAISTFNANGTAAINAFDTSADAKLDEVDTMITDAQGDVDAAVTQLKTATDQAVSAMEDALDGTTAGSLQNAINRTLKLDVADMTEIPSNASLASFTNVGSYCCKTSEIAATIGDCPIDDSPFNMYVFSSAVSGQVMQLVIPLDLQGEPNAELFVRFGNTSAMDAWSTVGGSSDQFPEGGTVGQVLTKVESGEAWEDVFPSTGATGQVLTKTDSGESWDDVFPATGSIGQVLTKTSDGEAWADATEPDMTDVAKVVANQLLDYDGSSVEDINVRADGSDNYGRVSGLQSFGMVAAGTGNNYIALRSTSSGQRIAVEVDGTETEYSITDSISFTEDTIATGKGVVAYVADHAGDALPEGGTAGQVLTKTGTGESWADVPQPDLSAYVTDTELGTELDTAFSTRIQAGTGISVSQSAGDVTVANTAPMPSVVPVSKGGTGVTTEDAAAQMVFQHAPEASPTQAGVVKTLSDQDFCEFMGIEYNPEDWS